MSSASSVSSPFCCCRLGKNGQKKKKELKQVRFMSQSSQLTPKMVTQIKVEDLNSSRSIPSIYETARSTVDTRDERKEREDREDNTRNFPSMSELMREIRMEEGLAVTDRSDETASLPSTSSSFSSKSPTKPTVAVISMPDATVPSTVIAPHKPSTFYRILSSAPQNLFLLITFTYTWFASVIIQFSRIIW